MRSASLALVLLLAALHAAAAQDTGSAEGSPAVNGGTGLPAVSVEAPDTSAARARNRRHASTELGPAGHAGPQTSALTRVTVYATSPLAGNGGGNGGDPDKVPGTVTTVDARQIERLNSLNVTDALQQYVPGVMVGSVTGNPFQPDVQFRGFTASPVSGTPQGLAVYQNGVRINEAFGDTVNWDLIPTAAIASVTVVTNNPAFGLNALGGALDVQMKNGFTYHGAEVDVMGGSFGRIQSSLQWGRQDGNFAVYGALEGAHDDGYRLFSPSTIRRFYGDVGYRNADSEIHLNLGAADNNFGAAAAVPIELLNASYNAVYTTPQTSTNQVGYGTLSGKFEVSPTWTVDGNLHYRVFSQHTQDGNPTNTQPCTANAGLLCYNDGATPAYGPNGQQLSNPFPANAFLGENDRTSTATTTVGTTLQATDTDKLFGFDNRFTVGGSFDRSITRFAANAELGAFGSDYVLGGSGLYLGALNSADGPVGVRTVNQYSGLYALDAIDLTSKLTVTGGGRFNVANVQIQDQLGGSASPLNGTNDYSRFNPIVGATYKITPGLTAYGGYSEANRAPTPLELGCANPARPCILATFLVADPPLQQVVSHTFEAGFRGSHAFGPDIGTLTWKVGGFRATNTNDILSIPAPNNQGFGYFANVGSTRRQGIEAEARLAHKSIEMYATYALIDARFLDALQLASNSPYAVGGNIQVLPGDQIPAVPRHRVKFGIDYAMTDALKVGADMVYVSGQYFVGDASNQAPKLPGYAVVNLHSSYQIDRTWQIYGRIDNLLNNHYATYGIFFDTTQLPNFAAGGAAFTDARALSPARPQAAYVGVKATF